MVVSVGCSPLFICLCYTRRDGAEHYNRNDQASRFACKTRSSTLAFLGVRHQPSFGSLLALGGLGLFGRAAAHDCVGGPRHISGYFIHIRS